MAWDDHEIGGVWFLSGDRPFDVMSAAVAQLKKEFLERWGRPPYLAELLYPLLFTAEAGPNPSLADETPVTVDALVAFVGGPAAVDHVEPGKYEGAFDAESDDFLILPHDAVGREGLAVRGQVEQPDERTVVCRYQIVAPALTDRGARCLIRSCVLTDLLDIDLTDRDLTIRFERSAT